MNRKKGKRILASAIGASGLLAAALIIVVVGSFAFGWDIWPWFATDQAFLVYALVAMALIYLGYALILWLTVWRHKK